MKIRKSVSGNSKNTQSGLGTSKCVATVLSVLHCKINLRLQYIHLLGTDNIQVSS